MKHTPGTLTDGGSTLVQEFQEPFLNLFQAEMTSRVMDVIDEVDEGTSLYLTSPASCS